MSPGTPASVAARRSNPLINRDYGWLWFGQSISVVGDVAFDTTLVLWIATRIAAGQSWAPLAVSGVLVAVAVPSAVTGPLAGVFADRWPKRNTLIRVDAVRAVLMALLPLLTGLVAIPGIGALHPSAAAQIAIIYVVVALATVAAGLFNSSRTTLISDVVEEAVRPQASGMAQISSTMAILLGPPIAAVLVTRAGVMWALYLNAASFVVSLEAIAMVRAAGLPSRREGAEALNVRREFSEGIRFFWAHRVLRTLGISLVVVMLGGGALNALDVFFVTHNLHAPPATIGLLSALYGAGALAGAVLGAVFARRLGLNRVLCWSVMSLGLLLIAYSRSSTIPPAAILIFCAGVPQTGISLAVGPMMIAATPRAMLGRVAAIMSPLAATASIVSIAVAGWLDSTVLRGFHASILGMQFGPVDTIFTASGLLIFLSGIYAAVTLRNPTPVSNAVQTPT